MTRRFGSAMAAEVKEKEEREGGSDDDANNT
jgi:hypothetical protein